MNEFMDYLPDYRWIHPIVPLEVFKEKYSVLNKIVSSEQMSPYKQYDLERKPEAEAQLIEDLKQRAKLGSGNRVIGKLKRLRGRKG